MNKRRTLVRAGIWLALAVAAGAVLLAALDRLFPLPLERLSPPVSRVVLSARGEPLRFFLARDQSWRFPAAVSRIEPTYFTALIASEDRHFHRHFGINPFSLFKAAMANIKAGRVVRGGSTITMQVARLAEPKPRTLVSKLVECFRALQLELRYSKNDILGFYAQLAPFGGNISGVGAASWFYFGKTPEALSLAEAALLAAIPRSPNAFHPVKHPARAMQARNKVLAAMTTSGHITAQASLEAASLDVPSRMYRPPLLAPHLAQMALAAGSPGDAIIRTGVDVRIQELARQAARSRLVDLRQQGVANAAIVVLDLATRNVLALVGSDDFLDQTRKGPVNAATAKRSPGSALKPFLYAMAFQDGLIAPESLLLDIPIAHSQYDPHNYDGSYRGRVEAQEALIGSFNTPAVRLLNQTGLERFHRLLLEGGLKDLSKPSGHYGLSLILGGGEVSLLDLTNLYATLARGGEHAPYSMLADTPGPGKRLLTPEACALTADILTRLERPDLPGGIERTQGLPAVAWKTGTSFGHRDAFAVGFSSRFAVGVWTGNVDGRPVKGISGARQAAPLLFDVFRAIEPGGGALPKADGLNLAQVEVCALSRQLPGPDCRHMVTMNVIPGVTQLNACTVHKRMLVDARTGLRLAGSCLDGRPVRQEVVEDYPPELVAWWRVGGMPTPVIAGPSPDCAEAMAGQGPRITSPKGQAVYSLRKDAPAQFQRVALTAQAGPDGGELSWFQDGLLVASLHPGESMFLELVHGQHRLVVVDAQGRSDSVRYSVE